MGQLDRPGCSSSTDLDIQTPYVFISYNLLALPSVAAFAALPWDHSGGAYFEIYDPNLATGTMPTPPTNPGDVFPHFFWDVATDRLTLKLPGLYRYELVLHWVGALSGFDRGCAIFYDDPNIKYYDWQGLAANDTWLPAGAPYTLISGAHWVETTVERGYFPVGGGGASLGVTLKAFYFHNKGMTIPALGVLATLTVVCVSRGVEIAYNG